MSQQILSTNDLDLRFILFLDTLPSIDLNILGYLSPLGFNLWLIERSKPAYGAINIYVSL